MADKRIFEIYRYDPDRDAKPYMQTFEIELEGTERMLLDALMKLKKLDDSIASTTTHSKTTSTPCLRRRSSPACKTPRCDSPTLSTTDITRTKAGIETVHVADGINKR